MEDIKMIVTDLDGTLLTNKKDVSDFDVNSLKKAQNKGVITAIATGRNLHKTEKVMPYSMPFNYAIVSSGAGVLNWESREYESRKVINAEKVEQLCKLLIERGHSFFIFDELPENHQMVYYRGKEENSDFEMYIDFNRNHSGALNLDQKFKNATQLMVSLPADETLYESELQYLINSVSGIQVIRSTSQLNEDYIWMEIFASGVSKGDGIDFLCQKYQINRNQVVAIGNDYNDIEMLDYAGHAYITENAPAILKQNAYKLTGSNEESGVGQAISNHIS